MTISFLERMVAFNNWANQRIIEACAALIDDQLDAAPPIAARGTLRETVIHIVEAQQRLVQRMAQTDTPAEPVTLENLAEAAARSGEGLLTLARGWSEEPAELTITRRGEPHTIQPWVIMLQALTHAAEHREQVKAMLTAHGVTPPAIDGWDFGKAEGALVRISD